MNLFVQIPCYNEEETIAKVLKEIPKEILDFKAISKIIIDDGSTDSTIEEANNAGANHIIHHDINLGLGTSFRTGQEYAIKEKVDILVNTDADNQYPGRYIPALIQPILDGEADIVIGNRQTWRVPHFSLHKKFLQWFGTRMVSILIGEPNIKDAVSGFRAYNRRALLVLNVTQRFSYVLDTTIQAKVKGLRVTSIDITTNPPTRPSRLFRSNFHHIRKSTMDVIRVYAMYRPMRFFFWIGIIFLLLGVYPMFRFLYDYFLGSGGEGMIQSLIFGSTFVIIGVLMFALGIIADLLAKNRALMERIIEEQREGND